LARGLLAAHQSQFLLLDEPTSSVDVENERQIYQNIFSAFSDKVVVAAIHSLHLLKNFDYIYFFRSGKIIAEGDFDAISRNENFQILWQNYTTHEK